MRWKPKRTTEVGERRIVIRFLWWPTYLDEEWRWLEIVRILQRYTTIETFIMEGLDYGIPGYTTKWVNESWVN